MEYHGSITPPPSNGLYGYECQQYPGGSASTTASYYPRDTDWSPETAMTAASTPPRSPMPTICETGPVLLPRVRAQDQKMEPATQTTFLGHNRTASLPTTGFPMEFGARLPHFSYPQPEERRSPSPAYQAQPVSTPSPFDHMINDTASATHSRRPSLANARSVSTGHIRGHSRKVSCSSIDASVLSRYGYPTYRGSPTPQPMLHGLPRARTPNAMSHLAPIAMPYGQMQNYPNNRRTQSPPANPSRLSVEVEFDPALDIPMSNALEYLTMPNPTPSLTRRTTESIRGQNTHFWYDVRNVRHWSDFTVDSITAVPDLLKLLQFPVTLRDLPNPAKVNLNPETSHQLSELCAAHHAVKVNAALRLTQGLEKHMAMRSLTASAGARQQPEFVSNYQSDAEKTIFGDGRGRVVGIVKSYDQWNSGMRNGENPAKVKYLQSLAHLHRFMREHGTRYGFIMTEIELVCVRAGGPPQPTSDVPLFGFLEVGTPVQVSASGARGDGGLKMTAGLALWWLHMLAKEQPFPGQYHWRMDVGGPVALTRQNHLPRDDWMPKAIHSDTREAKRIRGWVWPDEPLSKRECGRGRRAKQQQQQQQQQQASA